MYLRRLSVICAVIAIAACDSPRNSTKSPKKEVVLVEGNFKITEISDKNLIKIQGPIRTFEELSIVVNPANPDYWTGGAQVPLYYFTTPDNGKTWKYNRIRNRNINVLGDPALTADKEGNVYMVYIGGWKDSGIFCQVSTDKGLTFPGKSTDVLAHKGLVPFEDKAYPCADLTDNPQTQNNIYIAWTQFSRYRGLKEWDEMYKGTKDSSIILFARSTDRGKTFSKPIRLDTKAGSAADDDHTNEGAMPAVGPNGEVYVSWACDENIYFVKSLDAGQTFTKPIVATNIVGGWNITIPGLDRSNGMPVIGCDIAPNSRYRGTIYINWVDTRNGIDNTDVFIVKSTDGGKTWSKPIRVNQDKTRSYQFLTWMSVDPITGYIYCVFYDRSRTKGNATEVILAVSRDGGETWTNEFISEKPFTPYETDFFGDYIGISAYAGRVRPFWMHWENHESVLYIKKYDEPNLTFQPKQ
ncbi:MAG: sialidase family protein [Bacteroidia bacterium]|nr:sialidase family protein [Bacteroidia bacterium]